MVVVAPSVQTRLASAFAYIAAGCLLVLAARPTRRFSLNHGSVAASLHLLRFGWIAAILVWWKLDAGSSTAYSASHLTADLGLLIVAGTPSISTLSAGMQPWLVSALAVTWALSLGGFVLALMGRTADLYAMTHADWNDVALRPDWWKLRSAEERRIARLARDRQLERWQRTTKVMSTERVRQARMDEIDTELQQIQAEREHVTQLLSLGEITQTRHAALLAEIDADLLMLRGRKNELTMRNVTPNRVPGTLRVNRQDRAPESDVETVAIANEAGVPLFTYGQFHLDEALVAGIMSAFDHMSAEMFGSRVNKTQLAEGQVLHFAHGEYVVVLAIFVEEPSPRQIEQLRTMLQQFEQANAGPLSRRAWDTAYLHEVQVPFRFKEG
jgi:hypothetical protein